MKEWNGVYKINNKNDIYEINVNDNKIRIVKNNEFIYDDEMSVINKKIVLSKDNSSLSSSDKKIIKSFLDEKMDGLLNCLFAIETEYNGIPLLIQKFSEANFSGIILFNYGFWNNDSGNFTVYKLSTLPNDLIGMLNKNLDVRVYDLCRYDDNNYVKCGKVTINNDGSYTIDTPIDELQSIFNKALTDVRFKFVFENLPSEIVNLWDGKYEIKENQNVYELDVQNDTLKITKNNEVIYNDKLLVENRKFVLSNNSETKLNNSEIKKIESFLNRKINKIIRYKTEIINNYNGYPLRIRKSFDLHEYGSIHITYQDYYYSIDVMPNSINPIFGMYTSNYTYFKITSKEFGKDCGSIAVDNETHKYVVNSSDIFKELFNEALKDFRFKFIFENVV